MALAFIHKYELTISNVGKLIKETQTAEKAPTAPSAAKAQEPTDVITGADAGGFSDYATVTSESRTYKDLQLQADIDYNTAKTGKGSQPATIRIFNLNSDSLNFINSQTSVILKAGYRDDGVLPVIYVGQVKSVSSEKVGPDLVTTLLCTDGSKTLQSTKYSKTYVKGTSYGTILDDLLDRVNRVGIPTGDFQKNSRTSVTIPRALVVSGPVLDSINSVASTIDYISYSSLGSLNLVAKDEDGRVDSVTVFPQNVKGVISPDDDKSGVSHFEPSARPTGIKFRTFLNGNITTKTRLTVDSGQYAGDYTVSSVRHKLDFKGNTWDTEVECRGTKE